MRGQGVRIIVSEPLEWCLGNLFGTIQSDRGGRKLIVSLATSIKGKNFSSDTIELHPYLEDDTFRPLQPYYAVKVNGYLLDQATEKCEFLFVGTVAYD